MNEFLTSLGTIVTSVLTHVGTVGETIVSTPILLLPSGLFMLGAAISLFKRLL